MSCLRAQTGTRESYSTSTSPYSGVPVNSSVCIVTPLGVDAMSASRKLDGVRPSGNSRLPEPSTGKTMSRIVSIKLASKSVWASAPLAEPTAWAPWERWVSEIVADPAPTSQQSHADAVAVNESQDFALLGTAPGLPVSHFQQRATAARRIESSSQTGFRGDLDSPLRSLWMAARRERPSPVSPTRLRDRWPSNGVGHQRLPAASRRRSAHAR